MKKHINTEYVRVRVGLLGLGDGLGLGYGRGLVRGEQVSDGEFRGKCSGGNVLYSPGRRLRSTKLHG